MSESTYQSIDLDNQDGISPEVLDVMSFDDITNKLTKGLKKLATVTEKKKQTEETAILMRDTPAFKKDQEEKQKKEEKKTQVLTNKVKRKVDYFNLLITNANRSFEKELAEKRSKITNIEQKTQQEIQHLKETAERKVSKLEDDIHTLKEDHEKKIQVFLQEIEHTYEHNGLENPNKSNSVDDETKPELTLAEEKKILQLTIQQKEEAKAADSHAKLMLAKMAYDTKNNRREALEQQQKEDMKERMKQQELKERLLRDKEIETAEKERRNQEKRERNKKIIENLMRDHKVPEGVATIMFQYNRSRSNAIADYNKQYPDAPFIDKKEVDDDDEYDDDELETKQTTFFTNYLNTVEELNRDVEIVPKKQSKIAEQQKHIMREVCYGEIKNTKKKLEDRQKEVRDIVKRFDCSDEAIERFLEQKSESYTTPEGTKIPKILASTKRS